MHRVVIVGGGFAGLNAARALARAEVEVTVIDRRNFHLFQPLLYQVAAGELSPADIASPLRVALRRQKNARVLLGEVMEVDAARSEVALRDGRLGYDTLIVGTGASHAYFGHDEWAPLAPGLKTIEDATEIRRRVLLAFEEAEREADPVRQAVWLTFVIVGAGPTGVELAGALAEIANETMRRDFRAIDPRTARILLVEAASRVLPPYSEKLSAKAADALERLGVDVRTNTRVTNIEPGAVTLGGERIATHTVLWAAGVAASPLGKMIARATGATLDRIGRVVVEPDLTVPGYREIFVVGDLAAFTQDGQLLPGVAPVAMQQGRHAAAVIKRRLENQPSTPFRYVDRGSMAVIGRGAAVARIGSLELAGYLAWLTWLFVHIMYLVGFENRLLVLTQWAWNYLTWNRGARLITGEPTSGADPARAAQSV
jgi:NADH:ubiquinone reductase (H+-translocating)